MTSFLDRTEWRRRLLRSAAVPFCVALALAAVVLSTGLAHAQTLEDVTRDATGHINNSWAMGLNMLCWIGGGFLLLISLWGAYQHQRNPNAGPKVGMIGVGFVVGGIMLVFPFWVGTASRTITGSGPSVTGQQQMMTFDR